MRIVVLDGYTLNPGDLTWDELEKLGECTFYDRTSPEKVLERSKGAEILLTNKTVLTAEHISSLPDLKYIGVLATGYNVVDIEAAKKHHIVVTNIPSYSTPSVAQMVFAHILNITNRVQHYADEVTEGKWASSLDFSYCNTPLIELSGKKIGIIGLGHIGSAVAKIALGFDMEVWANTSKASSELPQEIQKKELGDIFIECDIITLHTQLNAETAGMINKNNLGLMKETAILINTGRGGLVNEQDLADALNSGKIMAAGLDVLSSEPPKKDNPLLKAKNCYITPHIAWASMAARRRLMNILIENIKAFQKGSPVNNVAL